MEHWLDPDPETKVPLYGLLTAEQRDRYEDGYEPFEDIAVEPLPPDDGPREWYWVQTLCEARGGFEQLTAAVARQMEEIGWFVRKQWPPCGPALWRLE